MALPRFLQAPGSSTGISHWSPSPTGGGTGSGRALSFAMQAQLLNNWCWSAVSVSVAQFYGTLHLNQCQVASLELGAACCPPNQASAPCNVPWYLDRALQRVGHFDRMTWSSESYGNIQAEVARGAPLGARVAWLGGGAHFMVVGGWFVDANGAEFVDIHDPIYGTTTATFASFISGYRTPGDLWTHSYFTAVSPSPLGGGAIANAPLSA